MEDTAMDADDEAPPSLSAHNLEAAVNGALKKYFSANPPLDNTQLPNGTQGPSPTARTKKTRNPKVGSAGYFKQLKKTALEKLSAESSQELTVCLDSRCI